MPRPPRRSIPHFRHPGRSAAESRDPADACRGPRASGSPRPPWIPDQVRDDGVGGIAGGFPARYPGRSIPHFRHPGRSIPHFRHPGRSAAESRDPADACRGPRVPGSPRPPWIPDQVRDDGVGGIAGGFPARYPGRSTPHSVIPAGAFPTSVIPAGAQRRAGIQRTPAAAPGCPVPPGPRGSRIKSGMTALGASPDQVRDDGLGGIAGAGPG
jgi:hypothetical protein